MRRLVRISAETTREAVPFIDVERRPRGKVGKRPRAAGAQQQRDSTVQHSLSALVTRGRVQWDLNSLLEGVG